MPGEPAYNNLISRIRIGDTSDAENSIRASAIPYGQVDSTSTATAFTATVPGINVLKDGVCVLLKNGVVTSASGFTINVNGLGAKPSYTNLAAATRDTTIFNIGYTMLFIYDEDRVSGGCWICYRGYDANTNTIGYQLRTNSSTLKAADKGYKYRLWFTSADGSKWVPANKSTSTDSTTSRTPNTTPINPFGPIVYNSTNGTVNADASLPAATLWQQYTLTIGYSFNEPGGAMTFPAPVYLKCTPQTNGSAVMVELVQELPSTDDGFIYILLGRAYSATAMELTIEHPVFYNDGTGIRAWTGKKPFSGSYTDLTNKPSIPTKTSDLTNDSSFITAAQAPVQSVNGQTGAVTTAEKFVITATAISGTNYYNLDKTFADIVNAIYNNKYVTIEDMDATYPYTTITSQGIVFGATLLATSNSQLMAVTDGILVAQSGSSTLGIAVHSSTVLPTMSNIPLASSTTPSMDGTADVGIQTTYARGDHVHPTDTSRASLDIVAPEWAPNVDYWEWDSVIYQGQLYFCHEAHVSSSTWDSSKWTPITVGGLAYTMMSEKIDDPSTKTSGQFLKYNGTTWVAGDVPEGSAASSTTPKMDGTASTGSENAFARGDHVHPTDTSRQAVLISGTNIKTINNESLLGSGNISISAGSSDVFIAEYGTTTYADILAAYEAGKAVFCQRTVSVSFQNTKTTTVLPLAYIGSSDNASSLARKAIFKNLSGNTTLNITDIMSFTVSGVTGQWTSENIETDTSNRGILSISITDGDTYLYSNPVTGIVKDDGTGVLSAAVAGTDYGAVIRRWTDVS